MLSTTNHQTLTTNRTVRYDGMQATAPNVFYLATGKVAYFAAAVGIVYDKGSHTQRFFLGHDDDILCMVLRKLQCLESDCVMVAAACTIFSHL